ncbi:hypothetical protein PseBG33_3356 [Pseudomonas synxantha BG33R]|uniref:hypothetical protein n=1 Tax=Pseudomonas TaxID=286 RepID=UPI00025FF0DE|nr:MULTISPECIES: hypothetical protein [Pseudomonas]EIK71539.1 hypothetical protein PseBG33_3356 [Pseudomonas synxantha BG33R]QOY69610.1 hypothetical protein IH404_17580 [Pseudomonas sp. OST1909]WPN50813.1 hypothetical protein QMK52_18120 [Pseudomonas sp. P9_2]
MITKLHKVVTVTSASINPPYIQEAVGTVIHLTAVVNGGTYVVDAYEGMEEGDLLTVFYKSSIDEWKAFYVVSASDVGRPIIFMLPAEAFVLGAASARYMITSPSGNVVQSPVAEYEVIR